MITVSLVILTHNRKDAVEKSLRHNLKYADYHIHEIIHVDNGSDQVSPENNGIFIPFDLWFRKMFAPKVQVINSDNLGVAKGYNRGMALATGTHIAITGCDRMMPQGWLWNMVHTSHLIENTGVVSVYSQDKLGEDKRSRYVGDPYSVAGVKIQEALPCEARLHSRDLLMKVGYFREDFGLYGFEDCEWADRVNRYTSHNGLINYILPDMGRAHHLPDGDHGDYKEMKKIQNDDPRKQRLVDWCHENGNPYYNPYAAIERDRLGE